MGSKTDTLIKLVLVFFLSLMAFSGGTFIGVQFSKSQHRIKTSSKPQPKKETYEEERAKIKSFAENLNPGECFIFKRQIPATYNFEKDFVAIGNIHYVIAKDSDNRGLLIAQPNPECKEYVEQSYKCDYWFRSVPMDEPFLISEFEEKIPCPEEFTKSNMLQRLKNDHHNAEFDLEKLK